MIQTARLSISQPGTGGKRMNLQPGLSFFGTTNMPISSHIRLLNIIRNDGPVSLYINGQEYFCDVPFAIFSGYTVIPPGVFDVTLYQTGDYGNPLIQTSETYTVGNSYTITATGTPGYIKLFPIPEPYSSPMPGLRSFLRLVNMADKQLVLDATLQDGSQIFSGVKFAEVSPYSRLTPNFYTLTVESADTGDTVAVAQNIPLEAGRVYSVYIVASENSEEPYKALFTSDSEITMSNSFCNNNEH